MVTAKATFRFDAFGRVTLDRENPFPLFSSDVATPLGLLPRDSLVHADPVFEVVLLGKAHARGGAPVTKRRVALSVGESRCEIDVYGDRHWLSREKISAPQPFTEMPLTFDRAFGGSFDVWVDEKSKLRISDPWNAQGRGFDLETYMKNLGEALRAPEGYPQLPGYVRQLPNLEDPRAPISAWDDAPVPVGWSAVPPEMGLRWKWIVDRVRAEKPIQEAEAAVAPLRLAYPDWVIAPPAAAALVELTGLLPQETVSFRLPRLRPVVDILNGPGTFAAPLTAQMLVLLPEETRFYMVYRTVAALEFVAQQERGLRLRIEDDFPDESIDVPRLQ